MRWSTSSMYWRPLFGITLVSIATIYFYLQTLEVKEMLHFEVSTCECSNNLSQHEPNPLFPSTCSTSAALRGPHQKVVAYSFYGLNGKRNQLRNYFAGISANAQLVKELYPGWVMRVYHAEEESKLLSCIKCHHPHVDLCHVSHILGVPDLSGGQGNVWRFLPLADPLVDVFLSRDLDSRLSRREILAVQEWLSSNKTFHIMRDHPRHTAAILAGMWGAKVDRKRDVFRKQLSIMLKLGKKAKHNGLDQDILDHTIWKYIDGDVMQHDSYACIKFLSKGSWRPWPSRRSNETCNFVGCVFNDVGDQTHIDTPCPVDCRPADHQNWVTC